MNQIQKLQQQIEAMQASIAASAAEQRKAAVEVELSRQAPNASEIVRRLAVAELSSADEVQNFLSSDSVAPLVAEQAAEQPKGGRPSLNEILSDIKNNGGRFGFGR